jgi:DNA (cytosine-5)-methyltransferase 1
MSRPRVLDLFCKAGGASMGLSRAGFDVVGCDIEPQPNYPFPFIHGNALEQDVSGFDFVWASPPCQGFTAYKRRPGHVRPRENLIPDVREKLLRVGVPFVIENVEGAPLENAVTLCGSMFGLDVRRHRLFEAHGFSIPQPKCDHASQLPRFPPATNRKNLRCTVEVGVWRIPVDVQFRAMGIDWQMTLEELSNAIPPAYSEHIGRAAITQLQRVAA